MTTNAPPHKYPLYYSEIASSLCTVIDRLKRAKSDEELDEAVRDYHRNRCGPDYDEFEEWVCRRSSEIISLRAVAFHDRPDLEESPYLDWTPAVYALICVCGETVDYFLHPTHTQHVTRARLREELSHALKNFDGAGIEVECAHELGHLREKESSERPLARGIETPQETAILPAILSAADIARYLRQSVRRVESFLCRYRTDHPDCFIEVDNPRRNEPHYLYRTADVADALR